MAESTRNNELAVLLEAIACNLEVAAILLEEKKNIKKNK